MGLKSDRSVAIVDGCGVQVRTATSLPGRGSALLCSWRLNIGGLLVLVLAAGCDSPVAVSPHDTSSHNEPESIAVVDGEAGPLQEQKSDPFIEVAETVGLEFIHFNGMSGEFYICEVKCAGCGLFDYDNDGDLDVYLVQGKMLGEGKTLADATFPPQGPLPLVDRIFRNDLHVSDDGTRTLRFTDVTDETRIVAPHYGIGVTAGDYDNDGAIDLYVTNLGPNQMFRNNGDGTFNDVTQQTGTDDPRYSTSAAFLDYDRDGWLDLFVSTYVNFSYATHKECFTISGRRDYNGPLSYDPLPDRLFRNRGDGTFEDVSAQSRIVRQYGSGLGVVCADFNGDGWPDIYVANDGRPNQLWINQQDGTFSDEAPLRGCALDQNGCSQASMGVDAGDFDADGDWDLFMTHLTGEYNTIYVNDGTGMFEDRSDMTGLGMPSMSLTAFGTAWFDYDNDGWLDLLVANGAVQAIEALARANDPYPLDQRNQLFRNLGKGRFEDVTDAAGAVFNLAEVSRGAAFGDVDNDGDMDVLITNNCGPPRLLINQIGNRRHWIGLRLLGEDGRRDLLGARVAVYRTNGPTLWRHVRIAASYCSANDPRILVGLGESAEVSRICVDWPDGRSEQWTDLPVDAYTSVRQGSGQPLDPE